MYVSMSKASVLTVQNTNTPYPCSPSGYMANWAKKRTSGYSNGAEHS